MHASLPHCSQALNPCLASQCLTCECVRLLLHSLLPIWFSLSTAFSLRRGERQAWPGLLPPSLPPSLPPTSLLPPPLLPPSRLCRAYLFTLTLRRSLLAALCSTARKMGPQGGEVASGSSSQPCRVRSAPTASRADTSAVAAASGLPPAAAPWLAVTLPPPLGRGGCRVCDMTARLLPAFSSTRSMTCAHAGNPLAAACAAQAARCAG